MPVEDYGEKSFRLYIQHYINTLVLMPVSCRGGGYVLFKKKLHQYVIYCLFATMVFLTL
jgi:hypothetical protein